MAIHGPGPNSAEISLTLFGGLCAEIAPSDLPEGASPLCVDMDFTIGSVFTRDGIQNAYGFLHGTPFAFLLGNGAPDLSGNTARVPTSLTNWTAGAWQFRPGSGNVFFAGKIPNDLTSVPNAQIVLDIFCADGTGTTCDFFTGDMDIAAGATFNGTMNLGPSQLYRTPSPAWNRTTLTFQVQSSVVPGDTLVVQIGTSPSGSPPTQPMLVWPYLSLNMTTN